MTKYKKTKTKTKLPVPRYLDPQVAGVEVLFVQLELQHGLRGGLHQHAGGQADVLAVQHVDLARDGNRHLHLLLDLTPHFVHHPDGRVGIGVATLPGTQI